MTHVLYNREPAVPLFGQAVSDWGSSTIATENIPNLISVLQQYYSSYTYICHGVGHRVKRSTFAIKP